MAKKLLSISRKLRRDITVAEKMLWQELRDRRLGGYKFRRQFPIEGFIVDFVCLEARVTIELDGPVHRGREQDDAHRRRIIQAQGFLEKRYGNEDVFERLHWVVGDIKATITERLITTPHPSPIRRHLLPQGEKED